MSPARKGTKSRKKRTPGDEIPVYPPPAPVEAAPVPKPSMVFWLIILWLGFCGVTLTFHNFKWLAPFLASRIPFQESLVASLVLFAAMTVIIRFLPRVQKEWDFSPSLSRPLLLICFVFGAFLRMVDVGTPPGGYSIDTSFYIAHVQHMVDLHNFQGAFIHAWGLLPVWPFTAFSFWQIFPDAPPLVIQRAASAVIDLAALGVLYLAGKEMGGRRLGILVAALASVSKPLLVLIVSGYGVSPMTLGISLVLLTTLKIMGRGSLAGFLWWGVSLGFFAYTVITFQPFIPFFIFSTFFWIYLKGGNGPEGRNPGVLPWGTFLVLLVYYLHCLNAFSGSHWISRFGDFAGTWILYIAVAFLVLCVFFFSNRLFSGTGKFSWEGWMVGAWLGTVLSFSSMTNEVMMSRIREHALVKGEGFLSASYMGEALHRAAASFLKLFWVGGDRTDMSIPGDAYFSYPEVILIALGLAFFLAKPNLKIFFLILTAGLGVVIHFVASETHSLRLIGCPPAFLLLGAFGLNELLKLIFSTNGSRSMRATSFMILVAFWVWSGNGIFSRVYEQWSRKSIGAVALRQQATADVGRGYRVYFSPNFADGDLSVLYEGRSVHLLHLSNVIALGPGEKIPDAVVFVGSDSPEKLLLEKGFPKARWSEVHNSDIDPAKSCVALRCQIAPEDLLGKNQKLFVSHLITGPFWERSYTSTNSGLGFGFLNWEDKTDNINDPVSQEVYLDYAGVRYQGVIHLRQGGFYQFHCKAINRTEVFIDGKRVFNLYFFRTGLNMAGPAEVTKTMSLGAGEHQVKVTTCFQRSAAPPGLTLLLKGNSGEQERSLWSSFVF